MSSLNMEELYACGLNAWNQLNFSNNTEDEPDDYQHFRCVLRGRQIEVLRAALTSTLVRTSSGVHLAGITDPFTHRVELRPDSIELMAEAGNGDEVKCGPPQVCSLFKAWLGGPPASVWDLKSPILQIVAGCTFFVALCEDRSIWTWGDQRYPDCLAREITIGSPAHQPSQAIGADLIPDGHFIKVVSCPLSYAAAALTSTNDVYLWGISPSPSSSLDEASPVLSPAGIPRRDRIIPSFSTSKLNSSSMDHLDVESDNNLDSISNDDEASENEESSNTNANPISASASTSTLNRNSDSNITVNPNLDLLLTREPWPLNLHGLDILDVAIGEKHILMLTTDGRVWVLGIGMNGQLGLGQEVHNTNLSWVCVDLGLAEGKRAVGVAAGPRTSFILIRVEESELS